MLSIIVPVYNAERYLDRCVESILAQSYQNLEVILVEDGSPDNCSAICDAWMNRDSRVRVIHQPNSGPSVSRNVGLQHANGEWITFVDSDDYLEPYCYEKTLHALEQSGCDMGIFGVYCEYEQGGELYEECYDEMKVYEIDSILTDFVFSLRTAVWNKIFRRSLIEGVQFPVQFRSNEDLLFIVEALQKGTRAVSCDYIGYHYVQRGGSITAKAQGSHHFEAIAAKDKACEIISEKFPARAAQAAVLSFIARLNAARYLVEARDSESAALYREYMLWMTRYHQSHSRLISRKHRVIFALLRCHLIALAAWWKHCRRYFRVNHQNTAQ